MRVCDPMLVTMATEFQVSVGEASRVISAFAVAYGCLQLFYGPLGDRVGKLRVINAAALACAVFSAITAMASDFQLLVMARAAMGASAAGISVCRTSSARIAEEILARQAQDRFVAHLFWYFDALYWHTHR